MAEDKLESVSGVIPQIINLLCMNKHEENVKHCDLVIRPNVKGYSAASFSARAIDSLLARGKVAALQDWGEIMRVKALDRAVSKRRLSFRRLWTYRASSLSGRYVSRD